MNKYKIAVLDDYQNVALESADWSVLRDRADIAVFQNHLADPDAVIERLLPFDVVCVMRERSPLPRNVIERLPNLKLIASTGSGNASIDRKSTRLNSSHSQISYAVFCLKKKKSNDERTSSGNVPAQQNDSYKVGSEFTISRG